MQLTGRVESASPPVSSLRSKCHQVQRNGGAAAAREGDARWRGGRRAEPRGAGRDGGLTGSKRLQGIENRQGYENHKTEREHQLEEKLATCEAHRIEQTPQLIEAHHCEYDDE